jgi:YaiO family outer membrane protein
MRGIVLALLILLPLAALAGAGARRAETARAPVSYETLFEQAQARAHAGSYESALRAYGRLLERYPDDADGLLGRGRVLAWMGRYDEALLDLDRATVRYPGYADAWRALGDLHRWAGRSEAAEIAYRRALDLGADAETLSGLLDDLHRRPLHRDWQLRLGASLERFPASDREAWQCWQLEAGRRLPSGKLALGWESWRRFGLVEDRGLADLHHGLWSGSYANLRLALAPGAETLPEADLLLDLYQALGSRWEVSLGARRFEVPGKPVSVLGLGLARYEGRWYMRLRLSAAVQGEDPELGALLSLRRSLGHPDDYLELAAGHSRASTVSSVQAEEGGWMVLMRAQKYLGRHWGLALDLENRWPALGPDSRSLRLNLLLGI